MEAISEPGPGRGQAVLRAALSVTHRHCLDNSPGVGGRISRRNGSYLKLWSLWGGHMRSLFGNSWVLSKVSQCEEQNVYRVGCGLRSLPRDHSLTPAFIFGKILRGCGTEGNISWLLSLHRLEETEAWHGMVSSSTAKHQRCCTLLCINILLQQHHDFMDGEKHGMTPPATGAGLADPRNRGFLEMPQHYIEVQHVNTYLLRRRDRCMKLCRQLQYGE